MQPGSRSLGADGISEGKREMMVAQIELMVYLVSIFD